MRLFCPLLQRFLSVLVIGEKHVLTRILRLLGHADFLSAEQQRVEGIETILVGCTTTRVKHDACRQTAMHAHQFARLGIFGKAFGQIGNAATGSSKDNAGKLVVAVGVYMLPHIGDYLLIACFHHLLELTLAHATVVAEVEHLIITALTLAWLLAISRAELEFKRLGIFALGTEAHDVGCSIVASQGDDDKVAQGVAAIDNDGGGGCTYIHKSTTRLALLLGEQMPAQSER